MTPEERKSMETTLAPAFKVNGSGKIEFNLDQYSAASDYPSGIIGVQVSTASYQAWLASFNAGGSALQSNMQAFAQRYSQANSTFDNLNKVLSGAIASLAESAKDVLKTLG
jgi:invasin D